MTSELELHSTDYHLRLMIDRMERDDRSEDAIESAVRIASDLNPPAERRGAHDKQPGARRRVFNR